MLVLCRVMLALVLAAAAPANVAADEDEDTVEVTFRLMLHGDVPATDTFYMTASFCTPGRACAGTAATAVFCGTGEDPYFDTPGPCKGNGVVYS